uniref:Alternative protein MAFB n=1 Tax=Homo sapiens TaxID=9606 RepID=L8ECC4_HUMAN|nr:alternative protein MAFB [Homo sapiens]
MLLIMDHTPLVSLGEKGSQFGNSGGCVRGFSPSCRLVNTRPAKPHRERGSKLRVFVWVYYYGIFVCKLKRKKKRKSSGHFASENNFVLGHTWKLHVFFPSLIPIRSSFSSLALVFNLVGAERENREVPVQGQGRAGKLPSSAPQRSVLDYSLVLWSN